MDQMEILNELKSYISRELLEGQDTGLTESTPLLEWGILDSLTIVSLLAYIEDKYHIHVPDDEVRPENFENLGALANMVTGQFGKSVKTEEKSDAAAGG